MAKKTGRPLKYKDDKEIMSLFTDYLNECVEKKRILTKAGWLFKLGISRETYREYKARPEFVDTLRQIEFAIEEAWLQRLTETGATGAIFYLKNAFKDDYRDRHETDITSNGLSITFDKSFNAKKDEKLP